MSTIIVGEPENAERLATDLGGGVNARIWALPRGDDGADGSVVAVLARALAELETDLRDQESATVLLADDSEQALAAALVATKLLLPVAAVERARDGATANGRLISQLAEAYTRPA